MKTIITLAGLVVLLSGCSWIHHGESDNAGNGAISGVDYGTGRGTTGVSSGAGGGSVITGSDAAPP